MSFRWIFFAFLLIGFMALAAGCGDDDDDSDSGDDDVSDDDDDAADDDDVSDDDDDDDDNDDNDDDDNDDNDDDNDDDDNDDDDDDDDDTFECTGTELRGTNIFDDSIRFCMVEDTKDGYLLESGWSFLTGLESGTWYTTFDVTVSEDFAFSPTAEEYLFEYVGDPFQGEYYLEDEDWPNNRMILELDGDYGAHTDLLDVFYAAEMPVECPENFPPFMFYEQVGHFDCTTHELIEWREDHTVETGQCFGVLWAISNPNCNWVDVSIQYLSGDEWVVVGSAFTAGSQPPCSWFSTEGLAYGVMFDPVASPTTYTWYFRILDGCQISSPIVETIIEFVNPE